MLWQKDVPVELDMHNLKRIHMHMWATSNLFCSNVMQKISVCIHLHVNSKISFHFATCTWVVQLVLTTHAAVFSLSNEKFYHLTDNTTEKKHPFLKQSHHCKWSVFYKNLELDFQIFSASYSFWHNNALGTCVERQCWICFQW